MAWHGHVMRDLARLEEGVTSGNNAIDPFFASCKHDSDEPMTCLTTRLRSAADTKSQKSRPPTLMMIYARIMYYYGRIHLVPATPLSPVPKKSSPVSLSSSEESGSSRSGPES